MVVGGRKGRREGRKEVRKKRRKGKGGQEKQTLRTESKLKSMGVYQVYSQRK